MGLDAQTLSQLQQQQAYLPLHQKHQMFQHNYQNHSFDEQQLPSNSMSNSAFYDQQSRNAVAAAVQNQNNLLLQAQSHSFNMDMMTPSQQIEFLQQQQQQFQRNNMKRSTLKRGQRVNDATDDSDTAGASTAIDQNDFLNSSQQQQQHHLLMMRQHQHNSSGQESGIGSSVYTNSAHGTNELLNMQHHPHLHHLQHPQHHLNHHNHQRLNNTSPHRAATAATPLHSLDPNQNTGLLNSSAPNSNMHSPNSNTINNNITIVEPIAPPVQLPRRKSLPSIVKSSKAFKEDETAHSSSDLDRKNQELFIIENGIRKRVTAKTNSALNQKNPGDDNNLDQDGMNTNANERVLPRVYQYEDYDDHTPELPRKILFESITSINSTAKSPGGGGAGVSKRVSMPSIPAYLNPKFAKKSKRA
jgi:hypothetical protein